MPSCSGATELAAQMIDIGVLFLLDQAAPEYQNLQALRGHRGNRRDGAKIGDLVRVDLTITPLDGDRANHLSGQQHRA